MRSAYEGHAGLREAAADLLEAWERMDYTPLEIVDAGDRGVVLGRMRLRGGISGIEFDSRVGQALWTERGMVVRERQFADWDGALGAAGIPTTAIASGRASA